jgi:hypothetical protein
MLGSFGGALEARHIDASNGKLVAEVTSEVEAEEGVIRRVHVAMQLVASEETRDTVERVHGIYAMHPACARRNQPKRRQVRGSPLGKKRQSAGRNQFGVWGRSDLEMRVEAHLRKSIKVLVPRPAVQQRRHPKCPTTQPNTAANPSHQKSRRNF